MCKNVMRIQHETMYLVILKYQISLTRYSISDLRLHDYGQNDNNDYFD